MMTTKLVNGERVTLTAEEETAHLASLSPAPRKAPAPQLVDVLVDALKTVGVLDDAKISTSTAKLSAEKKTITDAKLLE